MRQVVTMVLPLVLPAAIYFAWILVAQQRARARGDESAAPMFGDAPWTMLAAAGVTLVAMTLGAMVLFSGDDVEMRYVPPHVEDGRVVPGHTEPRK